MNRWMVLLAAVVLLAGCGRVAGTVRERIHEDQRVTWTVEMVCIPVNGNVTCGPHPAQKIVPEAWRLYVCPDGGKCRWVDVSGDVWAKVQVGDWYDSDKEQR